MSLRSFSRSRSGRDLGGVAAAMLAVGFVLAVVTATPGAVEGFHDWLHAADPIYVMDALVLSVTLLAGLGVYAFRRWRDLVREIQRRKAAEADLVGARRLVHICGFCRHLRDPDGEWRPLEDYVREHTDADLSHGLCPACARTHWLG